MAFHQTHLLFSEKKGTVGGLVAIIIPPFITVLHRRDFELDECKHNSIDFNMKKY